MEEHKMNNHKVLVNVAKDPSSSHFSGNECIIYRKDPFHKHHCSLYNHTPTIGHKLMTLLIANRQYT